MKPSEPLVLTNARKILADAETELEFLYLAQAEDIISVTVNSRSGQSRTVHVGRKTGHCLCERLIRFGENRVQRLSADLLRLIRVEGSEADIELKNRGAE